MAAQSVLIVDSDPESRSATVTAIATGGLEILEATSGADALHTLEQREVSLVLTEMVLGDMTGPGLLRTLRDAELDVAVVVLSSWASEADRVVAFEMGFDDFVGRPYSASELAARVRALLRRLGVQNEGWGRAPIPSSRAPDGHGELEWEKEPTPKERRLVEELLRRTGRVVTRRELLQAVWGTDSDRTERVVDAHVKAIRSKLGGDRDRLETVRGVGYRLREGQAAARSV